VPQPGQGKSRLFSIAALPASRFGLALALCLCFGTWRRRLFVQHSTDSPNNSGGFLCRSQGFKFFNNIGLIQPASLPADNAPHIQPILCPGSEGFEDDQSLGFQGQRETTDSSLATDSGENSLLLYQAARQPLVRVVAGPLQQAIHRFEVAAFFKSLQLLASDRLKRLARRFPALRPGLEFIACVLHT
jgi:hypothetical protein